MSVNRNDILIRMKKNPDTEIIHGSVYRVKKVHAETDEYVFFDGAMVMFTIKEGSESYTDIFEVSNECFKLSEVEKTAYVCPTNVEEVLTKLLS